MACHVWHKKRQGHKHMGKERSREITIIVYRKQSSKLLELYERNHQIIQSARTHKKNNKTKEDFLYGGNSDGD